MSTIYSVSKGLPLQILGGKCFDIQILFNTFKCMEGEGTNLHETVMADLKGSKQFSHLYVDSTFDTIDQDHQDISDGSHADIYGGIPTRPTEIHRLNLAFVRRKDELYNEVLRKLEPLLGDKCKFAEVDKNGFISCINP